MSSATQVASPATREHRPHQPRRQPKVPHPPAGPGSPPPAAGPQRPVVLAGLRVTTLMNVLIALSAGVTYLTAGMLSGQTGPGAAGWGLWALRLFALWCLSFLPGWLYV